MVHRPFELEENGDTGSPSLQMGKVRTRQDLSKVPSVRIQDSPTPSCLLENSREGCVSGPTGRPQLATAGTANHLPPKVGSGLVDMEGRSGMKQVTRVGGTRTCACA